MQRIVVISDIQAPLHSKGAVAGVTRFIKDYQPDKIAIVGDEADNTALGRWVRGKEQEYTENLQHAIDTTHEIMRGFREAAPDASIIVQRSNHTTTRLEDYIAKHAPALASVRGLDWASLMRYAELDIELSMQPTPIAPGWVMMHGDEGRAATYAAGTALKLSQQVGASVVCGHTHKQGIIHHNTAHSGRIVDTKFGMEVGHLMDMRKSSYLKFGGANWQLGFGLLTVVEKRTIPSVVPIVRGRFIVEGKVYDTTKVAA